MLQLTLTIFVLLCFFAFRKIASTLVKRYGRSKSLSLSRVKYTIKYFNILFTLLFFVLLGLVWDISFEGLSVYFLSFFTVAGIAFFASWSIISNITAAIIMFFYFPYRIGTKVRIMDGDNSVEGMIYDATFFSIVVRDAKGNLITVPNNLAFQKAIMILAEEKNIPNSGEQLSQ